MLNITFYDTKFEIYIAYHDIGWRISGIKVTDWRRQLPQQERLGRIKRESRELNHDPTFKRDEGTQTFVVSVIMFY